MFEHIKVSVVVMTPVYQRAESAAQSAKLGKML